jgi:hypothetical protein
MVYFILFCLLTGKAFAYDSGTCKSLDGYYKNIEFRVEETSDITYAVEFAKTHKGQLITDQDGDFYSVIWHEKLPAPATGYTCSRVEE